MNSTGRATSEETDYRPPATILGEISAVTQMDPTELAVAIPAPFAPELEWDDTVLPPAFTTLYSSMPRFEPVLTNSRSSSARGELVDLEVYQLLSGLKSRFGELERGELERLRSATNPYERVGNGPFLNRAAVKLANIDAVYHLTNHMGGLMNPRFSDPNFQYAVVADGPGGFVQYLQYRNTSATGYGITLQMPEGSKLNWDGEKLDYRYFKPYTGGVGRGDILVDGQGFVSHVLGETVSGVDLCTADGGFEVSGEEGYQNQEFLSSRLVMGEVAIALQVVRAEEEGEPSREAQTPEDRQGEGTTTTGAVRPGGHLLLKLLGSVTRVTSEILYILTQCFSKTSLFKPVSSRPGSSELYCICMFKRSSSRVQPWINILTSTLALYTETTMVEGFISGTSDEFVRWLRTENDRSTRLQVSTATHILQLAGLLQVSEGHQLRERREVDLFRCLVVWNLPGTTDVGLEESATTASRGSRGRRATRGETRDTRLPTAPISKYIPPTRSRGRRGGGYGQGPRERRQREYTG